MGKHMKPKVQRPTSSNGKNVNSASSRGEPPNSATHSRRPKNCWLIPALEAGKGRVSHHGRVSPRGGCSDRLACFFGHRTPRSFHGNERPWFGAAKNAIAVPLGDH